ncbi:MAG: transglutaminase family protein [Alphaproteobacteria bacterium]|nr:transglutaminase family protein [Alphaproteobacteria bacterium]
MNAQKTRYQDIEPQSYLENIGKADDDEIDIAHAALALAAVDMEGISLQRYQHHLDTLASSVKGAFTHRLDKGDDDSLETRLAALTEVLHEEFGYIGDQQTYDDLQNANLIRVIDRAKGLPITLSILYIHAARAQGWEISGLNIPGHFLCRLDLDGQRLIFDPFDAARVVEAHDLRRIVKKALGDQAELSSAYYEAASNRDILIRLQNNIKFRQIAGEDYDSALKTVLLMMKIDPEEYRLKLDAGVLYARVEQPQAAIECLSAYIEKAPDPRDRMEAEMLLIELQAQLH